MEAIKIYYNGFRTGTDKNLIRAHYSVDNRIDGKESVTIYGRDYEDLPRGYALNVTNDSDSQTDYFCNDRAVVFPDHPLYKYIRYAAMKADYMFAKRMLKKGTSGYNFERYNETVRKFEAMEDPGQPCAADLDKIQAFLDKKAAEAKEQADREREEYEAELMIERIETEIIVQQFTEEFPVVEGETTVTIPYSERSGVENGSVWSLKAAERIFEALDGIQHEKGGYDKTDFVILHGDPEKDGLRYAGRYDIGDGEGGLVAHIRNHAEYLAAECRENKCPVAYAEHAAEMYHRIVDLYNA